MLDAYDQALAAADRHARAFLGRVAERPVGRPVDREQLHHLLGGPLPEGPTDPAEVIDGLAAGADLGLVATPGPRFFGFVIGGSVPAALAADWLASAWDQNGGLRLASPASAAVERVVRGWILELLDLPRDAGVGIVTGGQMATWTCLVVARHQQLAQVGWDVEAYGLQGAPILNVVVGEGRHSTVDRALRFLGLGAETAHRVDADAQGRMVPEALRATLADIDGPTIVVAQAGEVNTGAFDPFEPIVAAVREHGGWLHVDGAFGLWARASERRRALTHGIDGADSWSVDAHKWLNVPYDAGFAITAHPDAHVAAMSQTAAYLVTDDARDDAMSWNPEASKRARAFPSYAAIRVLGRSGIAAMVDRACDHAARFAAALAPVDGIEVMNDVVLNQVLVRCTDAEDPDARTREVVRRIQEDGTAWFGTTTWDGHVAMRISVSNWSTTEEDVDRSVAAILRATALSRRDGDRG